MDRRDSTIVNLQINVIYTEKKQRKPRKDKIYSNAKERLRAWRYKKKLERIAKFKAMEEEVERKRQEYLATHPELTEPIPKQGPAPASNPLCKLNNKCLSEGYHCEKGKEFAKCKYFQKFKDTVPDEPVNGYTPDCFKPKYPDWGNRSTRPP